MTDIVLYRVAADSPLWIEISQPKVSEGSVELSIRITMILTQFQVPNWNPKVPYTSILLCSDSKGIQTWLEMEGRGGWEHVRLIAIDYHAATGTVGMECKGDQRSKMAR